MENAGADPQDKTPEWQRERLWEKKMAGMKAVTMSIPTKMLTKKNCSKMQTTKLGRQYDQSRSSPQIGRNESVPSATAARPPLVEIPGIVPPLRDFGAGRCLFAARCAERVARCAEARPEDVDFGAGHRAACWQAGAA